jgi:PKD repeat protein
VTVQQNTPPSATLSITPNPAQTGETVTFDATGSTDTDGSIVEYRFKFDDGSDTLVSDQPTVDHSYDQSGGYAPAVTVVDNDGATDTAGRDLVVEENEPPVPEFTVDPRPGTVGEPVTFDASASSDPDGTIVEYRWDFEGDGSLDENTTNPATDHTYSQTGGYVPTLTVVDDDEATATRSRDIVVERASSAVCRAEPT